MYFFVATAPLQWQLCMTYAIMINERIPFQAQRACVMERYGHSFYRSINAVASCEYNVRFDLDLLLDERPDPLPMMEILMHYPDGIQERSLVNIGIDGFSEYHDDDRYFIESPLSALSGRKGITFAELILSGKAIAGFAFSTSGPNWGGMCTFESIRPLGSMADAKARFEKYLKMAKHEDLEL